MDGPGYWGAVTSSVDWCEPNYARSHFVAELFNTLSSLAMVLAGLSGFWLHRRSLERRFLLAFLLLALVGVGSFAFHATLRFELQMLDELPMVYTALVLVYALLENEPRPKYGARLPCALFGYAVVATYLCAFTRGRAQFFAFQLSFGAIEVFALYRVYRLYRLSTSPVVRRLFRAGASLYVLAVLSWFVDLRACHFSSVTLPSAGLPNPQLHAVWHVLVSAGLYLLVLVIGFDRLEVLGKTPLLARCFRVVPYVTSRSEVPAPTRRCAPLAR